MCLKTDKVWIRDYLRQFILDKELPNLRKFRIETELPTRVVNTIDTRDPISTRRLTES